MTQCESRDNHIRVSPEKITLLLRKIILVISFSRNCFLRSFITYKVLKRFGFNPTFYIGLNIENSFDSHSWIQLDNILLCENSAEIERMKIIYNH